MDSEDTTTSGTTQNAQFRYAKHIDSLGTKATVRKRVTKEKDEGSPKRKKSFIRHNGDTAERAVAREIEHILETEAVEFLSKEIHDKSAKKSPLPSFPFFIFILAVIKDIVDIPAELSLLGIVLTTALSFLIALVLFFWFLGKMGGRWWKGRMVSWLWKRYALSMVLEFIPFFKIVPATVVLVLMAHFRETKTVKALNKALEALHSAKFKFDLK